VLGIESAEGDSDTEAPGFRKADAESAEGDSDTKPTASGRPTRNPLKARMTLRATASLRIATI
jgi:hypothetical protein